MPPLVPAPVHVPPETGIGGRSRSASPRDPSNAPFMSVRQLTAGCPAQFKLSELFEFPGYPLSDPYGQKLLEAHTHALHTKYRGISPGNMATFIPVHPDKRLCSNLELLDGSLKKYFDYYIGRGDEAIVRAHPGVFTECGQGSVWIEICAGSCWKPQIIMNEFGCRPEYLVLHDGVASSLIEAVPGFHFPNDKMILVPGMFDAFSPEIWEAAYLRDVGEEAEEAFREQHISLPDYDMFRTAPDLLDAGRIRREIADQVAGESGRR